MAATPPAKNPKPVVFVPHPDDAEAVGEACDAVERGEGLLSAEESAAYLSELLTPPKK